MNLPTIDDVSFEIIVHAEEVSVRGNAMASADPEYDLSVERDIIEELESGNQWAWCTVEVKATWEGIEESDFLGCCSYKNEEDFINGGYYEDMKEAALEFLHTTIEIEVGKSKKLLEKLHI